MKNKISVVLFFLAAVPALAARNAGDSLVYQAVDSTLRAGQNQPQMGGYFYKVFLFTVLVIGLIFLLLFVYRKIGGKTVTGAQKSVRVLARQSVGPRQAILIVLIENKKYAIGQTDHNLNLLAELGEASEEDLAKSDLEQVKQNFAGILANMRKTK